MSNEPKFPGGQSKPGVKITTKRTDIERKTLTPEDLSMKLARLSQNDPQRAHEVLDYVSALADGEAQC